VTPLHRHASLQGIGFAVLATACFATLDTTTRHVSAGLSVLVALWFRYVIQALITTAVVWPGRGRQVLRTRNPRFQLVRGLLLFACGVLAFTSLKYMPVGEFTAITLLSPLVITLFSAWMLKESIRPLRWMLVLANAGFQILTSHMSKTEDPITTHFYTGWIVTVLASLMLPFVWQMPADGLVWLQLLLMGLMGTVGHFFLILAYGRAPAATLTPYMYAQIGFGVLGGWIVFNHLPDQWTFVGMGLIALCGALGAWLTVRENRISIQPPET